MDSWYWWAAAALSALLAAALLRQGYAPRAFVMTWGGFTLTVVLLLLDPLRSTQLYLAVVLGALMGAGFTEHKLRPRRHQTLHGDR